jgi:hypothetical protein
MHTRCASKNLGPRARRVQLRAGVIWLGLTLAVGFALVELGVAPVYRWLLLLPMVSGTYAMLSGLFGVCIFAGARGARLADYGSETVADCALRLSLRNRGAGVLLASLGWAVLSTAIFVASASV